MKILYLSTPIPWPVNNGKKLRIISFLKALGSDHDIDLVCLNWEKQPEGSYAELKKYVKTIVVVDPEVQPDALGSVRRLRHIFSKNPYSIIKFQSESMKNRIREMMESTHYDCLICDGLHLSVNLDHTGNVRTLLNEHNIEYVILERFVEKEKNILTKIYATLEMKKLRAYERKAWEKFDRTIVCSEIDKKIITSWKKDLGIFVIPNTIEVDSYHPVADEIPLNICFLGGLDWIPNHDAVQYFCEEIYPMIKKQLPKASFTVIGRKPTRKIEQLAAADSSIRLTGTVNDIKPFLSQSQIMVVPLRMGSGTRLKILEAMAMRKPVVSTSIGAEGIPCVHGKDILLADSPEDFAASTVRLLKDETLRRTISGNGFHLVSEKYDQRTIRDLFPLK